MGQGVFTLSETQWRWCIYFRCWNCLATSSSFLAIILSLVAASKQLCVAFLICSFVGRLRRTAAGNVAYFVNLFPELPLC